MVYSPGCSLRQFSTLDGTVFGDNRGNQRDGVFLSVPWFYARFCLRIISLLVLAVAIYALYARRLAGAWRRAYVINALIALYLNVFVLIVQMFLNLPAISALAPTQSEPPFLVTQLLVLALFVALGFFAVI